MKLWKIPMPYDYHRHGEILIVAETREAAIEKIRTTAIWKLQAEWQVLGVDEEYITECGIEEKYRAAIQYDKIEEYKHDIYVNFGCDC